MRLGPSRRDAIAASTAVLMVIVAAGAVAVVAFYPTLSGNGGQTTNHQGNQSITSTSYNTFPITTSYSTTTYNTTTVTTGPTWDQGRVANATLGSPEVQAYIHDAWNYTFSGSTQTASNPILISSIIGVIGQFAVSGNWTTGYNMTFSHNHELNVTVQEINPNYFQVVNVAVWNQSDFTGTAGPFSSAQKAAMAGALSNNTVQAWVSTHSYYVADAEVFPSGNTTYGGDFLVTFYPISGTQILRAFVDPSNDAVLTTYTDSRAYRFCYSSGFCFNDPWVVTG